MCLVLILYLLFQNIKYRKLQNSTNFLKISIYACLHIVFDSITVYTVNHLDVVPGWFNRICHMIFFIVSILFTREVFCYVLNFVISDRKMGIVQKVTNGITLLYIVTVPFMQLDYLKGKGTNYSMGVAVYVGYGTFMFYCFIAIGILVVYRKKIEPKVVHNVLPMMIIM